VTWLAAIIFLSFFAAAGFVLAVSVYQLWSNR
jgi:hypothetical protein